MPRLTISPVPIVNEATRKKTERPSGAQRTANPKRRAKYSAAKAMSTSNGVTRKKSRTSLPIELSPKKIWW